MVGQAEFCEETEGDERGCGESVQAFGEPQSGGDTVSRGEAE